MLKSYFKIAWRNMVRSKVYSFINISGLSIGLACCMLIILYSKDELSFDRFHKNAAHIFRITNQTINTEGKVESTSGITGMKPGPVFKANIPEVKDFVRVQGEQLPVKIGTSIFDQEALYVDDNFFSIFSFSLLAGNQKTALKDSHNIVVSEETAKKFFGSSDAMGKVIELPLGKEGAFENFTVTGIVPKSPQNSSIKIQMLLPMSLNERNTDNNHWMNFFLNTFVVLDGNANIKAVEAKFKKVYEEDAKPYIIEAKEKYNSNTTTRYGLQPLLEMHLSKDYQPDNGLTDASDPVYTKILSAIALFILLIACINFINLTVARSLKRAREIGVRKVIGGERKQLIFQFLGESFLLSFFSFVMAVFVVFAILPFFNSVVNKQLSFSYLIDAKLIAGYIGLFLVTTLLAGFYPALVLSRFNPVETLYGRNILLRKSYLSKGLIVLQFSLATFLIVSTIIIYRQYNFLSHFDLGYNDKNLVVLKTDRMNAGQVITFENELKKNPAILEVAARQRGQWGTLAKVDGQQIEFAMDVVDTSFLSALEIPLIEGRNFSAVFPSDSTQSVLVNEAFKKKAGWQTISGKQVDFFYDSIKYNVIGVARNYHYASLLEETKPQLFIMNPKYDYGQLLVRIKPEHASETLKYIEKIFKAQQPFQPYKYDFKDSSNALQYAAEAKAKQVISFAAVLTIFISCIGLFGLATLAAEKRIKEIGIRKVLGASVAGIAHLLSSGFLKLVLVATLLAFPAAWWAMNKWLQNYPYRISIGVWVFVFAGLAVSILSVCTVGFQAVKSAVTNPVKNLRTE